MMLLTTILTFMCAAMTNSDTQVFTEAEKDIINSGNGIFRLYTADNASDTLFLRGKSTDISVDMLGSEEMEILKSRMLATVQDPENPGVGLAAPQIGISRNIIVVERSDKPDEPFEFYINPVIVDYSEDSVHSREGCLSVPGGSGVVNRACEITIRYLDEKTLSYIEERISGFTAIIFQHETDHLNGMLFTDRIEPSDCK